MRQTQKPSQWRCERPRFWPVLKHRTLRELQTSWSAATNKGALVTDRQAPTGSATNAGPPGKAATLEAGDEATAITTQSVTHVGRAVISLATVMLFSHSTGLFISGPIHPGSDCRLQLLVSKSRDESLLPSLGCLYRDFYLFFSCTSC